MSDLQSTFTAKDCKEILQNCFTKKLDNSSLKYVRHAFKSLSGDVEGYLSEHHSLTIWYEEDKQIKSKVFFVKTVLNQQTFLSDFAKSMDVFRKENFIYSTFFAELQKVEHYKEIVPKCYFSKENILVLEDLTLSGYNVGERLKFYNVSQCKAALKTLSYYHAYSIIFEEMKAKKYKQNFRLDVEYSEELMDRFYGENCSVYTTEFLQAAIKTLCDVVMELPEDRKMNKEHFLKYLLENFEDTSKEESALKKHRKVCTHGDLWATNIMFKYNGDEIVDCKIIDFQILNYTYPAFDIELLFYGNTTTDFRQKHKNELLHYYYDSFLAVLAEQGIDGHKIISFEDLELTCVLRAPEAKVQAISDMSLLYLPEIVHREAAENPDNFKKILIDERSKYILNMFKSDQIFRDVFTKELTDLFTILLEKKTILSKYI